MRLRSLIPAYRQRRIEAAQIRRAFIVDEQRQSQKERYEHQQESHHQEIIGALQGIERQQHAYAEQRKTESNRSAAREWRRFWLDVSGVFVAAAAAVFLLWQQHTMQGQLDEMRDQRLMTMAQTRAYIRRDQPLITGVDANRRTITSGTVIGFDISPRWTNTGSTNAQEFRFWYDVTAQNHRGKTFMTKDACPNLPNPLALSDAVTVANGTQIPTLAIFLSFANALEMMWGNKIGVLWGYLDYKDIFYPQTRLHYDKWCVGISPNNLEQMLFSFPVLIDEPDRQGGINKHS